MEHSVYSMGKIQRFLKSKQASRVSYHHALVLNTLHVLQHKQSSSHNKLNSSQTVNKQSAAHRQGTIIMRPAPVHFLFVSLLEYRRPYLAALLDTIASSLPVPITVSTVIPIMHTQSTNISTYLKF